jgi:hypothetical protein
MGPGGSLPHSQQPATCPYPDEKYGLDFHENHKRSTELRSDLHYQFHPTRTINAERTDTQINLSP